MSNDNQSNNDEQSEITLPIKRTTGETLKDRLTPNAYDNILPARYLKKDTEGNLVETQEELFKRVGQNVALAEAVFELNRQNKTVTATPEHIKPNHHARGRLAAEVFGFDQTEFDDIDDIPKDLYQAKPHLTHNEVELSTENINKFAYDTILELLPASVANHVESVAQEYVDMHEKLKFVANSPTLMNAGDDLQQLSACFVDSPDDDMDSIHETAKEGAKIFQSGGGLGYAFWRLRPKGDPVGSSGGISSGPITFMNTYDQMCETVAQGGCVFNGERIMTDKGYIPFGEIHQGSTLTDAPSKRTTLNRKGEMDAVRQTVDSGPMDAVRVQTQEGYQITVTPNHPLLTIRDGETEWVPAGELNQDETVVLSMVNKTTEHREELSNLDADRHPNENSSIKTPNIVTDDFAKFVGLLWGDGTFDVKNTRLVFTLGKEGDADQNSLPFLKEYLDSLNVPYSVTDESERDKGECYRITVNSSYLTDWLLENGIEKQSGALHKIPEVIYRSPPAISSFLGGLTCDGSIEKDASTFSYSTAQKPLAREIQDLLLTLGIPSKIQTIEPQEDRYSDKPLYVVTIAPGEGARRFNNTVDHFFDEAEKHLTGGGERQNQVQFASDLVHRLLEKHYTKNNKLPESVDKSAMKELRRYERGDRTPSKERLKTLLKKVEIQPPEILTDDVYYATVETTQSVDSQMVSDIEVVDGDPEFIASNFLVHNTRRGAQMGIMRVSHPDVLQFIHSKNKDVSLAHTLRLNDPDDYTHNKFIDALNEARELIDEDGKVPKHLRNAVEGHLSNFNISVGITDDFMEAVKNDEEFTFTNPRTGETHIATPETVETYEMFGYGDYVEVGEPLSVPAREIWDDIIDGAHENGEPGVIYLERANKKHSFDVEEHPDHRILATNPCGEQPLEEYEACNLGHINFSTLVAANPDFQDYRSFKDAEGDKYESESETVEAFLEQALDWEEFNYRIEYGTRFLEDVVTMSDFPIDKIEEKVSEMRKIGLGIMGYAQMLVQLGIQYGSEPANEVAKQMMTHMNHQSKEVSHRLAVSDEAGMNRGVFDEWDKSKYAEPSEYEDWFEHHTGEDVDDWEDDGFPLRNHNTTTIAPTGCVSEDSLVSTTSGLSEIGNLEDSDATSYGQWSDTESEVSTVTDTGVESIGGVYDNSLADVKTITTRQGFSISATPNHRFRVFTEDGKYAWREAGEFEEGDNIVLVRNTFSESSPAELDASELDTRHHNTAEDLSLSETMTDELAEFLGYYMGDGYVHEDVGVKLVVDSRATELEERLVELSESVFGVTPTVEDKDSRRILSVGGRHLSRYFEDNGWDKESGNKGEGAASAFVPSEVLSSKESHLRNFIAGLFEADGTASRKVELSTVSETLASQVQTALLSLGVVFVRQTYDAEDLDGHYGDRTQYRLRGANRREDVRFADEIGFITKEFETELSNQSYKNDSYPPAVTQYVTEMDGFDSLPSKMKKRVRASKWNGRLSRRSVRDVEKHLGEIVTVDGRVLTDLYVAEVSSVSDDTAYTRDVEVPSTNTYTANGFVSHNTTSMVGNTTGGCEPMFNVAYMKNVSDDVQGDEMLVEFDDYFLRVLEENDIDVEPVKEEAQELMNANEFEGAQDLETVPDEIAELFITTSEISGLEHASVQCAFQQGVDSSISKTVNFPNDATKEDMREVYEYIYENGGKGVTVYRDGTRSKQVLTTRADNKEFSDATDFAEAMKQQVENGEMTVEEIIEVLQDEFDVRVSTGDGGQLSVSEYRKRPDSLVGINQRVNTGYGTLYVWISEDENGDMFEVFASIGKAGGYTQSFTEALCRMISMALRYGVPPNRISDHLSGIQSPKVAWEDQEQVSSVADGIAKAINDYLEYGGVVGLIMEMREGDTEIAERLAGSEPPEEMNVAKRRNDVTEAVNEGETVDLTEKSDEKSSDIQEMISDGEMPECPDCGAMNLYYSEGCKTCESCGWSEC